MKQAIIIFSCAVLLILFQNESKGETGYGVSNIFSLDTWSPLSVKDGQNLPKEFELFQNFPNPFNPSTTIHFSLSQNGYANVDIYDVEGKHIRTLYSGYVPEGKHEVQWDGTNGLAQHVGSGIYFYRLKFGDVIVAKKMLLIR